MMNKKVIYIIIFIIALSVTLASCQLEDTAMEEGAYKITNINIYKDTPAWELALAVDEQDVNEINEIVQNEPDVLNYQDPKYGATLLLWSIGMEKYASAKELLECGADPNISSKIQGETPLFTAAGYSWVDNYASKDPKFVKLLLDYDANPNIAYGGYDDEGNKLIIEPGTTPLMRSIGTGIKKTIALVEAGADVELMTDSGRTASVFALGYKGEPEYAHYLIVQLKANVTEPYYTRPFNITGYKKSELYQVDLLRKWIYGLDSEDYKLKMEIVDEFERQGVNYWATEIDESTLEQIQKLYPNSWESYIKSY